jgi:hypothetical protein
VKSQFSLLIRSRHWTAIILTAIITSCGVSQPPPPILATPDIDTITDPVVLQASSISSPGGIVVLSSDPTANAFNVFPKSPITLTFSAEMNRSSVERSASLFPERTGRSNYLEHEADLIEKSLHFINLMLILECDSCRSLRPEVV